MQREPVLRTARDGVAESRPEQVQPKARHHDAAVNVGREIARAGADPRFHHVDPGRGIEEEHA
jgi:hypothetical protein